MIEYQDFSLHHFSHCSLNLVREEESLWIDPFHLPASFPATSSIPADYLVISHHHFDHCSPDDFSQVYQNKTQIVTPANCTQKIAGALQNGPLIHKALPYKTLTLSDDLSITPVPAYNLNKKNEQGALYHPSSDDNLGFVLEWAERSFYYTGDTDAIPEFQEIADAYSIDVLFLPISGVYVMTIDEALSALEILRPQLTIPVHYGDIVGERSYGKQFQQRAEELGYTVRIDTRKSC